MYGTKFLQFEEDAARLPEGFQRISYDSDTRVYTFKDRNGVLYRGEPGNEYGRLTPVGSQTAFEKARPGAFASSNNTPGGRSRSLPTPAPGSTPSTFSDFLPANLMTNSSLATNGKGSPSKSTMAVGTASPNAKFQAAVKKSSMMSGVVGGLRRSITTMRKGGGHSHDDDLDEHREALVKGHRSTVSMSSAGQKHGPSSSSSKPGKYAEAEALYRSSTASTTRTERSAAGKGQPMGHS